MLKNWHFWTVVLEKTLESPFDCKETQPVNPKGIQFLMFIGRTDAKAFDCVDHNKLWKILKEMGIQTSLLASWEICVQVKKQQLEPDMEKLTGSKLGKE